MHSFEQEVRENLYNWKYIFPSDVLERCVLYLDTNKFDWDKVKEQSVNSFCFTRVVIDTMKEVLQAQEVLVKADFKLKSIVSSTYNWKE